MQTQMVNFMIPNKLLRQVDILAARELRSRSELLREAAHYYLKRQKARRELFTSIRKTAARLNLSEEEAMNLAEKAKLWARGK